MSADTSGTYCGRFAPSPTGPLHFGSLLAAVASHLDARHRDGRWLLRMEDLDRPREQPGAADAILRTLENFALYWDGPVLYQSRRTEAYRAALAQLHADERSFACTCTRREIADSALPGLEGPIYPGTCRAQSSPLHSPHAIRVCVDDRQIGFDDRLQGHYAQNLARDIGDFVVLRADGIAAYQLAVVVDDAEQGITQVVRGSDLLISTPRQIHLQQLLGLPTPDYLHLPVAVNAAGEKLSKQTHAASIDTLPPLPAACAALTFLGQRVPEDAALMTLEELWAHAARCWDIQRIPRTLVSPEMFSHPAAPL